MKKNKIVIQKASLKDDILSLSLEGKTDKEFKVSEIKKFTISKSKTPRSLYLIIPIIVLSGYFVSFNFLFLLVPFSLLLLYLRFYYRNYKLTLIDHTGMKYKFTFYKKLRSVLFDIRLKVKYMLLTN
jgi:hypothetical protein